MKIVVFGPDKRVGALAGSRVVDLGSAGLPADLEAFIEGGATVLADAGRIVAAVERGEPTTATVHDLAAVQLHAPHVRGARIACAGGNFADHTIAMAKARGDGVMKDVALPEAEEAMRKRGIWGFWKVGRDAAGPGGSVIYPENTQRLDYEGELAIVIGRPAKDVAVGELRDYVWGVTLFADWSIRDANEGNVTFKFATQKNFDTSYSIGPCIVAGEDIDPADVDVETYVNGELRQRFNTRDMVMKFGEYLAHISRDFTFHPGDMITGGTAAGTAADSSVYTDGKSAPDRFLKAGDEVEMRSPRIGTLASRIVPKKPGLA
jgi:2-keto-4-pentenoate hydratase/2-oxohepta-3-ene-1,7-dioic acid hydratase in catechol pathway